MRFSNFSGYFYPFFKEEIIEFIQKNEKDVKDLEEKIVSAIVPHAGWQYSGKCALHVYKNLKNIKKVFVVATNHSSLGKVVLSAENIKTTLGIVEIDKEAVKNILNEIEFSEINELVHANEHSIEVQLPFLQYYLKDFKLVPILVSNLEREEVKELAKKLSQMYDENSVFIFSGDFIHHGKIYGFEYFKDNKKENVRKADLKFVDFIIKKDLESFLEHAKTFYTICGYYVFQVYIELTKELNLTNKLLCYYNSADVTKDEEIIVGYASIIGY